MAARILLKNLQLIINMNTKNIMTGRPKLDKVLQDLQKNPYFDKYSRRIAELQSKNPDELVRRVEHQEAKIKKEKERNAEQERKFKESKAKPFLRTNLQRKNAELSSIMKLEMIENKSKEEIITIWEQYHKQKDCICGTMTPEQYNKMFERGLKYNTFLLPLPREQGYEFIVCQFAGSEIHMTPLIWYQAHNENAPECLTMIHYTELKESKGIVLMRGEFDKNSISVQEAQCLANELQLYYCTDNSKRLELLETFTNKPNEFKHMELVSQLETISLDSKHK